MILFFRRRTVLVSSLTQLHAFNALKVTVQIGERLSITSTWEVSNVV
jgi:hypothetical protein